LKAINLINFHTNNILTRKDPPGIAHIRLHPVIDTAKQLHVNQQPIIYTKKYSSAASREKEVERKGKKTEKEKALK
jgi:hypothetical protein